MSKNVVLGVTGGIACYKTCQLVSSLKKKGYSVDVIMTKNACEFVSPLTFETLSGRPVVVSTFDRNHPWEVEHISLAKKADIFVRRKKDDGKEATEVEKEENSEIKD